MRRHYGASRRAGPHLWDSLSHSVVWSNDVGEQAQSACFSPDGEVIVVGTVTGKWVVLSTATREVFSVNQVRNT